MNGSLPLLQAFTMMKKKERRNFPLVACSVISLNGHAQQPTGPSYPRAGRGGAGGQSRVNGSFAGKTAKAGLVSSRTRNNPNRDETLRAGSKVSTRISILPACRGNSMSLAVLSFAYFASLSRTARKKIAQCAILAPGQPAGQARARRLIAPPCPESFRGFGSFVSRQKNVRNNKTLKRARKRF